MPIPRFQLKYVEKIVFYFLLLLHDTSAIWQYWQIEPPRGGCEVQYNKVEICGVNTSKLKVLTEKEKMELLRKVKDGDMQARDELIRGNLRLVLSVIQRFTNRGENLDDLFQVGCIGLIKAIDHFDINQGVRFSTYGVPMIIGEIRRYLRDNNSIRVSRSLRDTAYKAMQVKEKMIARNSREPTVEEIAKELDIPREEVVVALESIVEPISLYEPVFSDGGDTIYVMDQVGDNNDDNNWLDEIALKEAIKNLNKREKNILAMRYFQGKTQVEVASEIGISQAQVSRLEKAALDKIKKEI
jgi:RNA polymerase sporulation-specific sigma factor